MMFKNNYEQHFYNDNVSPEYYHASAVENENNLYPMSFQRLVFMYTG